jgi:hypothetical protein
MYLIVFSRFKKQYSRVPHPDDVLDNTNESRRLALHGVAYPDCRYGGGLTY